ncbi:MAG: hypothetical protein ABSD28_18755 [Tepidisphaeraceae bacterium]|jgi:hypothetical protein
MGRTNSLLETPTGKSVAIVLAVVAIGVAVYVVKGSLFSSVVTNERTRMFVDATTGQGFRHELQAGESIPIDAPSGHKTGYPAELCYWTKDGTPKSDPTPVLLNIYIGKPEPTFCPDCGRLVVARNPIAQAGMRPPPTREEWEKQHMVGVGPELLHAMERTN